MCYYSVGKNGWEIGKVSLVFTLRKNLDALFVPHRLTHPHIHK